MPKEITHIYFSDILLEKIKDLEIYPILKKNINLYNFGSIATDTFYYNIKLPFERNFFQYGDIIHGANGNDTSLIWINFLKSIKEDKENYNEKIAFISGFITHCIMDINFHPFVYYFSGNYFDKDKEERLNAQMRHRIIESWLDLYILDKLEHSLKDYKKIKNIYSNDRINLIILYFFCEIAYNTWKIDNTNIIFNNIKRGYFIQKSLDLYFFKNSKIREFFRIINNILNNKIIDYLALFYPDNKNNKSIPDNIINFNSFLHPYTGEEFKGNISTLFDNAIIQGVKYLNAVNDFLFNKKDEHEIKNILIGYSLDMGLYGAKVENAKYFNPLNIKP